MSTKNILIFGCIFLVGIWKALAELYMEKSAGKPVVQSPKMNNAIFRRPNMSTKGSIPETGFLRLSQVLQIIPVSKSSWYAGVSEGRYPKPVPLGPRAKAYRAKDIRELVDKLEAEAE